MKDSESNRCTHENHQHCDRQTLFLEALFVGVSFFPVYWAVRKSTTAFRWKGDLKDVADVVLTGFLYHLGAEEIGLNEWYLTNGHVAKKSFQTFQQSGDAVDSEPHSLDWIRNLNDLDFC